MNIFSRFYWISVILIIAGIYESFAKMDFPNQSALPKTSIPPKPGDEKRERFLGDFSLGFTKFSGAGGYGLPYGGGIGYGHGHAGFGGFQPGFGYGGFNPYHNHGFGFGLGGFVGGNYGFKNHYGYQHHHHHSFGLGYPGWGSYY